YAFVLSPKGRDLSHTSILYYLGLCVLELRGYIYHCLSKNTDQKTELLSSISLDKVKIKISHRKTQRATIDGLRNR
ncbi:MAG: hypothetical protein M3297_01570, partial [Thermoproteota archaeon]|nr:hypothetical protein [Thermoproteota archaeon]